MESGQTTNHRGGRRLWKRLLGVGALLVGALVAGAGLYVYQGVHDVPAYYATEPLTGEERLRAIESVERKVLNLQGQLDRAYAVGRMPAENAPVNGDINLDRLVEVSFTAAELDTYFRRWLEESGFADRMRPYLENPRVALVDGKLILAGRVERYGTILSLHFLPDVAENGATMLRLDGVYAGRIPLPPGSFEEVRRRVIGALDNPQPEVLSDAEIMTDGTANREAVLLVSQRQLVELLDRMPVRDMIVFPPLPGRGYVPARVARLDVENGQVTLGVKPLSAEEAEDLRRRVAEGYIFEPDDEEMEGFAGVTDWDWEFGLHE